MNIVEGLRARAAAAPDAAAIIDLRQGRRRSLSFAELDRAAAQAAGMLRAAGLRPGDGVLLLQPMSIEFYVALLAIFRLGLVAMILDPSAGRDHVERCCALKPPRALIAGACGQLLRLLSPALRQIPLNVSVGLRIPGAVPWSRHDRLYPSAPIHPCPPETPALLTFTSGTTGQPKAAVRSHGFLLAQHRALEQSLDFTPGELDLTTLPVLVLANLASGVTSLIPDADLRRPGAVEPEHFLAQLRLYRPTRTVASPALMESLADYCQARGVTVPSLRKIFCGGAPVFPRLLVKLKVAFPCATVAAVYGSTEAEPMALLQPHALQPNDLHAMAKGRGVLAGWPASSIRLRILRDQWGKLVGPYTEAEFTAACMPPGEAGEIVVSGDHVLAGYLYGHGDTETKFAVGGTRWHRTGDAGYLDDRGRLWLLGRCAARIEDRRGTLYPLGVECAALENPGIRRAAFVGYRGRRVLVLERRRGADASEFASLGETLAWARIDEIQVHRRIPVERRHNAKVDYPALSARLSRRTWGRRPSGRQVATPPAKRRAGKALVRSARLVAGAILSARRDTP
jgi:acyl-CoA synthetase (AMP-forming)/AMP-acid ligase II